MAIFSIEKPLSIRMPKKAVPKAVANTIRAVVSALMEPIYFTPYISAHVEDPRTFAKPLEIPISPRNTNAEIGLLKYIITITDNRSGKFIKIKSFLLVNLSIKKPDINKVITDNIE